MAKILIVDDHPDIRAVLGQLFQQQGHQVTHAESAEAAWDQIQSAPPDAIVVDQRLPGMSGIELLQQVRKTQALNRIAVVLCSGDDRERQAALNAGACDFWLKGSEKMFDAIAGLEKKLADVNRPK